VDIIPSKAEWQHDVVVMFFLGILKIALKNPSVLPLKNENCLSPAIQ